MNLVWNDIDFNDRKWEIVPFFFETGKFQLKYEQFYIIKKHFNGLSIDFNDVLGNNLKEYLYEKHG